MNVTTYKKIDIDLDNDDIKILEDAQNLIAHILSHMDDIDATDISYRTYGGDESYSYEQLERVHEILENLKEINEIY